MVTTVTLNKIKGLVLYLTTPKAIKENKRAAAESDDAQFVTTVRTADGSKQKVYYSQQELEQTDEASSITDAANKLINLIADSHSIHELPAALKATGVELWQFHKACLLAHAYAKSGDIEKRTEFRRQYVELTRHDDMPVHSRINPEGNIISYEDVLKGVRELNDLGSNFSQFHIAAQGIEKVSGTSLLEEFLLHAAPQGSYKKHSPTKVKKSMSHYGKPEDFPGPGLEISNLGKDIPLFTREFLEGMLLGETPSTPRQKVEFNYRKMLVETQRELQDMVFGSFRCLFVLRTKRKDRMLVDGEKHAVVVYNNHIENPGQEVAFVVPNSDAESFLANPMKALGKNNKFHPNKIRAKYGHKLLDIFGHSVLTGFDKTFPHGGNARKYYPDSVFIDMWDRKHKRDLFYPERVYGTKETNDGEYNHRTHLFSDDPGPGGHPHQRYWQGLHPANLIPYKHAHDEVRDCIFYAMGKLKTFWEAFELFLYGHKFNQRHRVWTFDRFNLLRQIHRFKNSTRYPENEKPVLVGLNPEGYSRFTERNLEKVGIVCSDLMLWLKSGKDKNSLDGKMLPGNTPDSEYDLTDRRTWNYFTSPKETENWLDFLAIAEDTNSKKRENYVHPVFYHAYLKPQLIGIMKNLKE